MVPPEERVTTFDQDGTLWVEHPMYTQVLYCLDRVRAGRKLSGRAAEPRSGSVYPIGWPIRLAGWVGKKLGGK